MHESLSTGKMQMAFTYLEPVLALDGFCSPLVDVHRPSGKAVILFKLAVHQVQRLCELGRTVVQGLLEQVSRSFNLGTAVTLEELGEEDVPELESDGVAKEGDSALVDLEGFLKVLVLFQEVGIVDDNLGKRKIQVRSILLEQHNLNGKPYLRIGNL